MRQQTKLFAPRQHLRTEAGGDAKQPNANGDGLQPVGDGKAAVKNLQRAGANVLRGGEFEQPLRRLLGCVRRGQRCDGALQRCPVCPSTRPQPQVVGAVVAAQADVVGAVHHHRAALAGIVTPYTCYKKRSC